VSSRFSHNLAISLALVFFLSVRMLQGRKEGRKGVVSLCSHRLRLAGSKKERKKGEKERKPGTPEFRPGLLMLFFFCFFLFLFLFLGGVVPGLDSRLAVFFSSH
jgi:hypothetical protein